ncbi:uncharacterized protein FIESC28_03812 [Fusarium coffeatum]|uniref:Uncharacterized protein n=1 Tax=Fusarium coffeatum TaxID=231269 RepID=A0A366S275_9HYPO|nr:uncharacterized protein FIESC28_03812 [Fusarium coffeatum]RBR23433.1 hypothetical protein FIESC28_03812 [Fusarium coffeatum]
MDSPVSYTRNPAYSPFTDAEVERRGAWLPLQPNVTATDEDGSMLYEQRDFTLLCTIVSHNDTRALREYLANGSWAVPRAPDIPSELIRDTLRMDYFHVAALNGCLGVLQMLLAYGTKGDVSNPAPIRFKERGYELLHEAVKWGHIDVAKFLLENQPLYADIHERDPHGLTPILSAANFYPTKFFILGSDEAGNPPRNEGIVNLLLDYGASASDVIDYTDMDALSETVLTLASSWAGAVLIKRLIEGGAEIRTKVTKTKRAMKFWNQPGDTFEVDALFVACAFANFDAVKTIFGSVQGSMQTQEMCHSQDSRGTLPIHWATQNAILGGGSEFPAWVLQERVPNITAVIDFLLNLDPTTINVQDNDGNTPLHYAARAMGRHDALYAPVFTFLCERGADASIRNHKGQTPLHSLFKLDGIESHYETSNERAPVMDTTAILTLLAHGANVTDADDDGNTPSHLVADTLCYGNAASLLLDHGADPARQNSKQETALHRAARGTYRPKALRIKAGEKIKAQDEVIGMLVKVGGDGLMELVDAEGKSPRQLCEEKREAWKEQDIPAWKRQQNQFGRIPRGGASRGGRGGRGG